MSMWKVENEGRSTFSHTVTMLLMCVKQALWLALVIQRQKGAWPYLKRILKNTLKRRPKFKKRNQKLNRKLKMKVESKEGVLEQE